MELLVIYDANCKFCTTFAEWAKINHPHFQILSVRSKEAKNILKSMGIHFINLQTIYFVAKGKVLTKSKAIFAIMQWMPFPWRVLSFLRVLPLKLTDYLYSIFAKYRYKL